MFPQSLLLARRRYPVPTVDESGVVGPMAAPVPTAVSPNSAPTGPPQPVYQAPPPTPDPMTRRFPTPGNSVENLGTFRDIQQQGAEGAYPGSKITMSPQGVDIAPPTQHKPSRWKMALQGIGEGIRQGAASGMRGTDLLAAGVGAGAAGAISPGSMQQVLGERDVAKTDAEIQRRAAIERAQAQTRDILAQSEQRSLEPQIHAQQVELERAKAQATADREAALETGRAAARTETQRHNVVNENIGQARVDRMGQSADKTAANTSERTAKINEGSALYKKADAIDANANALDEHIKKLEDGMVTLPEYVDFGTKQTPKVVSNPARTPFKAQLKDLRDQQQKLRKEARDRRTEGDKADAEGRAIPEAAQSQSYTGRTMSQSNLARYAKDKGITADEARKRVEAQGVRVQ